LYTAVNLFRCDVDFCGVKFFWTLGDVFDDLSILIMTALPMKTRAKVTGIREKKFWVLRRKTGGR